MIFRTYAQVAEDIREWSKRLPPFAAVCGIPRSGTLIASMLAQFRHCHLVELSELAAGKTPWTQPHRRNIPATDGTVLVIDDTCWSGRTIGVVHELLQWVNTPVQYGALYSGDMGRAHLDHPGRRLSEPYHSFQWNMLRDCLTPKFCLDMDGVLCEDWIGTDVGHREQAHLEHLENALPLYKPAYSVKAIVTGRLGCHRAVTERWLAKHGIRYGELVMFEGSLQEREQYGPIRHKACHYERLGGECFVESNLEQATGIAKITGKPVLSIEGLRMFNGIDPDPWPVG